MALRLGRRNMRVSGEECLRISQIRPVDRVVTSAALGTFGTASMNRGAVATAYDGASITAARGEGLAAAMAAVDRAPETREQVVESLRARVEAGAYSVSGEQVAEMMIRRLIADQVR